MTEEFEVRITRYTNNTSYYPYYQVDLRIPIDLDFDNQEEKILIYRTWREEQNVPEKYQQAHYYISQLQDRHKLFDIPIVKKMDGSTFLSIIYTQIHNIDSVLAELEKVFQHINVVS